MIIGMHTWSFRNVFKENPEFTIFNAIDQSADMGFKSMEVLTGKANCPVEHIGTNTIDGLNKVVAYAKNAGIPINCYSTYNDFAYFADEDWRLANIEYIKTWLRLAGETGVPNIRMLTGYYSKDFDAKKQEEATLKGIEEVLPYAEKHNVTMAIENHNSIFFDGPDIVGLIENFGSKYITACPDCSNGYDPFQDDKATDHDDTMFDNLATMAPHATNAHLKIKGLNADGQPYGWDLDRYVQTLIDANYNGPIHFESIGEGDLLEPLVQAREALQAAIDRVTVK